MRQIILDTETTGLEPKEGHRVIEIGAVELIDRTFTGNNYHQYINPERDIEAEALEVHGITNDFLADKPSFAAIMNDFINYVKGAELIIHNAPFDVGFLNYEFNKVTPEAEPLESFTTIFDTLALARKTHPGKKNSLDALCKRYNIDNSGRTLHGALLDAELLGEVYLAMTGGQMSLFDNSNFTNETRIEKEKLIIAKGKYNIKVSELSPAEEQAHQEYLEFMKSKYKDPDLPYATW